MAQGDRIQQFAPFQLDLTNQCLWRDGVRIPLAPKVFAVLDYLVRHAGRLVPQEEILEAVWPETYVQPEVLRTYILEIRRALEDPARNPRFIETSPKRGYRFIAEVRKGNGASKISSGSTMARGELVGRAAVLAELAAYLQECCQGHRRVVFITGEAGIGKTTLVDVFSQQQIADSRMRIARGQCVEGFAWKEAYYPVLEAIGSLLRTADGADVREVLSTQAPTWLAQFPGAVKAEETDDLRREVLGATRDRMMRELCDALETLTITRPLILTLEDLQWVDNATLDLLSAIARRRAAAKLLVLATYRPVEVILSASPLKLLKQDLLVHRLGHEIGLTRLTESDVEEYVTTQFPANTIARKLAGPIHRHSDGNPLFMRAILDRVVKSGIIDEQRGALTSVPTDFRLEIPETLQQMLETQLEQLATNERSVLRTASVIGRRFPARTLAAMLDVDPEHVEEVCGNIVANERFLKPAIAPADGSPQGAEYEFKHVLYRDVLYQQLKPTQRRQLHLRLGNLMEAQSGGADTAVASELAFHFEQGRDCEKAIRYLVVSAAGAMQRYAHGDSLQMLHRALDLLPQTPAERARELELEILERISDSLYAQGEMLQSAEIDRRAAELAAQRGLKVAQVHALTRVARALAFLDPERCIAVCDRAAEVSRDLDDPLLKVRAELLAACWHIVANGWDAGYAEACATARNQLCQLSQELAAYYEILYAHVECIRGDYADALRTAGAGIAKAVETDSLVVYLSAHSSLAHALLHLGRWGELLRVLESARDVARKNKNAPWLGVFEAHLAWLHFHACDFEGALRLAGEIGRNHAQDPDGQIRTMAAITAAFAQIELGAAGEAIPRLISICERPEHPRFFMDWYWRRMARLGLSRACLLQRDEKTASREADLFLRSVDALADPSLQALAWEMKARVAMGEPRLAREYVGRAFAVLQPVDIPGVAWRIHACASQICACSGDESQAQHHREQAAALMRRLAVSLPEEAPLRHALLNGARVHPLLQSAAGGR